MIDLGDAAGDDLSRAAYNAFTRALSSRKTVNKTNIASGDTDGAIRDVPAYIRDAAAPASNTSSAPTIRTDAFSRIRSTMRGSPIPPR